MFQLLSQVAGRSGRAEKQGMVYFQTWQPDHPAIQAAREHDYKRFARTELSYRKALNYPPYSKLINFTFKGSSEENVQEVAEIFTENIFEEVEVHRVLGPSPLAISRMQNEFRWETLLKEKNEMEAEEIEELLERVFERFENQKPAGAHGVRINVNVDAIT